ncbi:MAG: S8 family peptidase [Flavobacteriales bacterium]|nr:S8 family peptidase [Flavobacteriales bacterium]
MRTLLTVFSLILVGSFYTQFTSDIQANFWTKYFIDHQADTVESVGVFVKGNQLDARSFVEENGGLYRGEVKGWQYIRIPGNVMKELVVDKRFSYVDYAPYKGVPMNDTMRVNNRINQVHQGMAPLGIGYTGSGVAMGFIDTGIDFEHGDFNDASGNTRILQLWDQTKGVNAYTPSQYGYGRHWNAVEIDGGLCTNNDQYGHGSTVAGTGCGNGLANGTHMGVAPNSHIIVVESKFNASDWLATVVDATEYIYSYADSNNVPCSINASLGTYLGSHDGLDPYALYIDSLIKAKNGRLFTASAGNSGDWPSYHVHNDVTSDTSFSWYDVNPSSAFGGAAAYWELWADTADFNQVKYAVGADKVDPYYSFRGRTVFRDIIPHLDSLVEDTIYGPNNDVIASLMFWAEQRDGQYLLQVLINDPDSADYDFRFETFGSGSYDVWSTSVFGMSSIIDTIPSFSIFPDVANYVMPDSLQSIVSSFQCSPNVVTVGNYSNDSGFVNIYGNWIDVASTRGEFSKTSSIGPNRQGDIKPNITASGYGNMSSAPSHVVTDYYNQGKDTLLAYGGLHMPNGGTSMSSPVVAGVGALLLEKCPNLSQADFIEAITSTAYQDSWTGSNLPNYAFGYGKIDGFAAVSSTSFLPNFSGDTSFCEGGNTTITISSEYPVIEWESGSTNYSDVFLDTESTYFIAQDSMGCIGDTAWVMIVENNLPIEPSILINGDSLIATTGYINYEWDYNGLPFSSTGSDSVVIAVDNGNYWVTITDSNGCQSISQVLDYQSAGRALEDLGFIQIYPNPSSGLFTVVHSEPFKIVVSDGLGKVIVSNNVLTTRRSIDLSSFANGVYWVEVFTNDARFVQKIVLNK